MDKEDFKIQMLEVFEEAQEEFMGREVRIPHQLMKYECPECFSKDQLETAEFPGFKCEKCKCEARLEFVITKKGI